MKKSDQIKHLKFIIKGLQDTADLQDSKINKLTLNLYGLQSENNLNKKLLTRLEQANQQNIIERDNTIQFIGQLVLDKKLDLGE